MTTRQAAFLAALVAAAVALAGCAGDAPAADGEPISKGATSGGAPTTGGTGAPSPAPTPRGTSERWHFHDHWQGNPTITLLETEVAFNATLGPQGVPALSALVALPNTVIVPPETGFLTFNVSWETGSGLVNLTYRPADSQDFFPAGDMTATEGLVLRTTESMCDVPHRQQSAWLFNLTAMPDVEGASPVPPSGPVLFTIQATIGRPLFIDPPHLDWWQGLDALPLVEESTAAFTAATTPAANLSIPGSGDAASLTPDRVARNARVAVDEGSIVPEGARSIVVQLSWASQAPDAKLKVRYRELNLPSEGDVPLVTDGEGSRVFAMEVRAPQTDTTYSNRTTWEFEVVPDGDPAAAFTGEFTLKAWVTKLAPAEAAARYGPAAS